jgi:putative hydrolase of the HAD superfamily
LSIKAVVFDYGNVISLPQDPKTMDVLAGRVGVERDRFVSALWSLRGNYDRGTISAKEYFKTVLSSLAVFMDEKSIEEIIEIDTNSWKNINTETEALMKEIKAAGYLVGILSNVPSDFLAWARKNLPVFSLPHIGLYSCDVNLVKPEEAIYRKLLSMSGVEADELVFFDDKAENIKGAEAIGIKAILWENSKEARRELLSLGVKL